MPRAKKVVVSKIASDAEILGQKGEYFDASHYHTIITSNCDVYKAENGELLCKFRKKMIPVNLCKTAMNSFRKASKKKSSTRGAAAGILDRNKIAGYVADFVNPGKVSTKFLSSQTGKLSGQSVTNLSQSNIVGYYDKRDRNPGFTNIGNPPCRLTSFSRDEVEKWEASLPFIRKIDECFFKLVPNLHKAQQIAASRIPEFQIMDTAFSTLTINYSWRSAMHKDAGDYKAGFGTLVVCEDEENPHTYEGCYLGFPQFGICVDLRQGDFLAMDVHEWHCNTEFYPTNSEFTQEYADNVTKYQNQWHFNRLSVVSYFREGMSKCIQDDDNDDNNNDNNDNKNDINNDNKKRQKVKR